MSKLNDPPKPAAAPAPRTGAPPAASPAQRRVTAFYSSLDPGKAARPPKAAAPAPALAPADEGDGPLRRRTIELVQASWAKVMPISDAAASLFYERLFELEPAVRPLFKDDIAEQKKKLMQTLGVAVDGLTNLERLVPALQSLGARHAGYMVQEHHYDVVGEALLWTLREGLGDGFTDELEAAWREVYALVADVMKKAASAQGGASAQPTRAATTATATATATATNARGAASALPLAPIPLPGGAPARGGRARGVVVPTATPIPPPPESASPAGRTLVGISEAGAPGGSGPSQRTIALVQASWAKVMPISDAAASLFYERLFELDPSVRPLFKDDIAEQKKKLMQTLSVAVDGLGNLGRLVPVLQALGARHAGYMVQDHHYDLVGEALLWTLREGLGDGFTDELEAAWKEVYALVADVMRKAGAAHTAGPVAQPGKAAARPAGGRHPSPSLDDEVDTLHYDTPPSSRPHAPAPAAPARVTPPTTPARVTPPTPPTPPAPPAPEPAAAPLGGIVVPLGGGQEVTLNLRVKLDQLPALLAHNAPAAQPSSPGGLAPALLLGALCVAASMAISVAAPNLGGQIDRAVSYGVPLALLVLVVAAFGLGYLFGRSRKASGGGG